MGLEHCVEDIHMFIKGLGVYACVIKVGQCHTGRDIFQDLLDQSGVGGWSITESKWHAREFE